MARIAYLDHSFHRTTQSNSFLVDVLRRHRHTVDMFWDDSWQGGAPVSWDDVRSHDVVILFQSYCVPDSRHFRQSHPNVIYIPMLDQFGFWQGPIYNLSEFWEPFQGSKVLSFSNALHCMVTGFGIVSHFARYYQPLPTEPAPSREGLHGFFWLRREQQLPWRVIRRLIENTTFDSFHIHLAVDPGTPAAELPPAKDVERHRITTSTWFEDKSDLDAVMARANVYFAPRLEEGIGQSFLEAMGRGQCVVAPNQGTMNEYLIPGLNGLLYEAHDPQPLDFSQARKLGLQAREGVNAGRAAWENAEGELVRFILAPSNSLYAGRYQHPLTDGEAKVGPVAATSRAPAAGLRAWSSRYAIFRSTRFLWHPIVRLLRQLKAYRGQE